MIDSGFQDVLGQIRKNLLDSPCAAVREIRVELSSETILLTGRVASYYQKQLVQETVRSATRGFRVVNDVDVCCAPNEFQEESLSK